MSQGKVNALAVKETWILIMKIVAYLFSDPLVELSPDPGQWGWDIHHIYRDLGSSQGRPQLQQLLKDAEASPVDYLLVRQLEELGSSIQEISDRLVALADRHIRVIAIEQKPTPELEHNQGIIPATDLRVDLLKLLQEIQRQQRSRLIRQGHARNRLKALPPPGKAPYGYRRGKARYALDRSAASVIKDFFEHFLLYGSLRGAVRYIAKKHSKSISVSTGHRWLTNPVYRGDLAYQNGDVVPNTHVPIISRDEAAQVDRLLRRNRRLPPRTASAPRSLAGLVVCGECEAPMIVTRVTAPYREQEYLYLRPKQCPQKPRCASLAYEQVLEQIIQRICQDLPLAVSGAPLPRIEVLQQNVQAAIAQKQAILAQLPDLITTEILDPETAELRAYKLRTEIAKLQDKLAQLPPVNLLALAQTVSIPRFWLDLSETERRFYFREFIREVRIIRQADKWQCQLVFIFDDLMGKPSINQGSSRNIL
jgi:DNA invertase Pin-like site-specific DNA recombinase